MRNIFWALCVMMLAIGLIGCGDPVEIPPAHVGKITTDSGLQEGIIPPSKMRLEGLCLVCDGLIIAETSDYPASESMQIFMPKDTLNLRVDVRGIFSVSSKKENVEKIFARLPAEKCGRGSPCEGQSRVMLITMDRIYKTYAQPVVRETVRSIMIKYTIAEIMTNRDAIGQELAASVVKKLANTPITTTRFGLANVQPPKVIVEAQESAKKREIQIQEAEADKLVRLKKAEGDLEVAKKEQAVDLKEAETQVMVNKKLASSVSNAFIQQRMLKVLEAMAKNPANKVFFMPTEAMRNPAIMTGAMNHAFRPSPKK